MNLKETLAKAQQEKWAVGAFNAGNLELAQAVMQGAANCRAPIIIETSAKEAAHFGMANFLAVVNNFKQETGAMIFTNLDHGPDLETVQKAVELGYDMVHFDGSKLPVEENLKITKLVVALAREKGVVVEAEMDAIMGSSEAHTEGWENAGQNNYTDPQIGSEFVAKSGCDMLAVSIGNRHGTYLQDERLNLELMRMIQKQTPCWFSLHGGSGINVEDVKQVISLGVVKININTELRVAYRDTLENILRGSEEVAVHQLMPPVIAAVQRVVEEKIKVFYEGGGAEQEAIPYIKPN